MGSYNCTCYPEYTGNGSSCTDNSCIIHFLRYLSVATKFCIFSVCSLSSLSTVLNALVILLNFTYLLLFRFKTTGTQFLKLYQVEQTFFNTKKMSFLRLDMRWARPVAGWPAFLTRMIRGSALALLLCGLARLPRTRCNLRCGNLKQRERRNKGRLNLFAGIIGSRSLVVSQSICHSVSLSAAQPYFFFLRCWRLYRSDR